MMTINILILRRQAESFYKVAESISPSKYPDLGIPYIVNLSFSAELFLKVLITQNGGNPHGHKLHELFEALPEDCQNEIFDRFKQYHDNRISSFSSSHPRYDVYGFEITRNTFNALIIEITNAFVAWRYVYEKDSHVCEIRTIQNLTNAAKDTIEARL